MAIASGWKREDAVVSHATRRLENWISCGVWNKGEVDEGTPLLAQALAALLGARAVLLLVDTPGGSWQPVALAQSDEGRMAVAAFSRDENLPLSLGVPLELPTTGARGPLLRDDWEAAHAVFVANALALVREEASPAPSSAVLAAPGEKEALDTLRSGAREPSLLNSGNAAQGAEDASQTAADVAASTAGVLDSGNVASDFMFQGEASEDWRSQAPSLLMLLPSSSGEESEFLEPSEDEGSVQPCGAVLAWLENEDGRLSDEWRPLWSACSAQAGAWLEGALRFERVGRSYRDLTHLVVRVVEARDERRVGHGPLVAHACVLMAQALELSAREVEEWEMAGLLHGIGRVPIPDTLLFKQGSLLAEERDAIRSSMQTGAQWLGEVEGWSSVAHIVKHAGERWDGHGYPNGLEGEAIPLGSRALAIAQRFAALAQARPDRGALGSLHNVGAALESEAGRALDPRLISIFQRALRGGAR